MLAADDEPVQVSGSTQAATPPEVPVAAQAPEMTPASPPAPAPSAATTATAVAPVAAAPVEPAFIPAAAGPETQEVEALPQVHAGTVSAEASPTVISPVLDPVEQTTNEEFTNDEAETSSQAPAQNADGTVRSRLFNTVKSKVDRVTEMESVQKGMQLIADKSKVVRENERVQQGVKFVKQKTTEIAESERVQKGLEMAKETAKAVSEKTQKGLEMAKDTARTARQGASNAWETGRGSIQKARASVSSVAWLGSARDTLDMAAREEQWKGIKVQGAEEITVPARTEHTCSFVVKQGCTLRWTFRVKDNDVGFGVRMRVQEWGGSREEEVLPIERYDNADTVSGSWMADQDRTMVLAFDNKYSRLRSKTVAYIVGTEKPPVFQEPAPESSEPSQDIPVNQAPVV